MSESRWKESCDIAERIVIEGELELDTPAHFGNGDAHSLMDMPVMRDPADQTFVLTGSSIAGALRAYLEAAGEGGKGIAKTLFGEIGKTESNESALVVYDARSEATASELRDNVRLDPTTKAPVEGAKFDMEVIEARTTFKLRFDLHRREDEQNFVSGLGFALAGLQNGEIGLGKRKTRGFGQCHAQKWRVRRYAMTKFEDMLAWIKDDRAGASQAPDIKTALGSLKSIARDSFEIKAVFSVDGSLIIRASGSAAGDLNAPDAVHLTSRRGDRQMPIISGTSLAGALRARATRIANTFNPTKASAFVEEMFGMAKDKSEDGSKEDKSHISKVWVKECVVENAADYVLTRVKIDRFTGGAYPSGLFTEQPIFGKPQDQTRVSVSLALRDPSPAQIGLLLLLLKDLWTGDLPLGGESGVGRGRLCGQSATLSQGATRWELDKKGKVINQSQPPTDLQTFVDAFVNEVK